jgi:hypothetical protein
MMRMQPLTFLHQFEVRKSVFGKSITDADIRQDKELVMGIVGIKNLTS